MYKYMIIHDFFLKGDEALPSFNIQSKPDIQKT